MVSQKDKLISDLTKKLDQQNDYDDIKRELSFARSELSHFGSAVHADPKLIESYLSEKAKSIQSEAAAAAAAAAAAGLKLDPLDTNNSTAHQMVQQQRNNFINHFSLPQLPGLGNVESFGTLLGEEIANIYAKNFAKPSQSSLIAMAAAAASNATNSNKSNTNNNQNSGNNVNGT